MPILANAKKALRVSKRKAAINKILKSQLKTAIDKFTAAPSEALLQVVYSHVDKSVKKNIFHKNRAARIKSRLSKVLAAK